mgnify:CR=1 FL=1
MKFKLKILAISATLLVISSCSSNISKQWSCRKVDSKLGCVSISEADHAYSVGLKDSSFKEDKVKGEGVYSSFEEDKEKNKNKQLVRTSDQVGRIWLSPYMDADNNYHEESFVRVVDETSKWEVRETSNNFSMARDEDETISIDLNKEGDVGDKDE